MGTRFFRTARNRAGSEGTGQSEGTGRSKGGWAILGAAIILLSIVATDQSASGLPPGRIAYYDPDANHATIALIQRWFTAFLRSRNLQLTLQPVQSQRDFERLLADGGTRWSLVASSYLRSQNSGRLKPVLVPQSGGSVTYRKVLVDNGDGVQGNLRGAAIAATVPNAAQRSQVLSLLQTANNLDVSGATVIPVSKDIDALLALQFHQVRAALVTRASIEVMRRRNPTAAGRYRTVFTTNPILRPVMCEVGNRSDAAERQTLRSVLTAMHNDQTGRRALQSMGLQGWVPFQRSMVTP